MVALRMMRLRIEHRTEYTYSAPVSFGDQYLFLRPRDSHLLVVDSFAVETFPVSQQRWVRDAFNNVVLVTNTGLETANRLLIDCRMTVRSLETNPFDFVLEPYATGFPFTYEPRERNALAPSIETPVEGSEGVLEWFRKAVPSPDGHPDVIEFLNDLNSAVGREMEYVRRDEEGIQTPEETLQLRAGSCRDMAVLFLAICRRLGLATRFVSGYLYSEPEADGAETYKGWNRAAGSMHAWAEVYLPGAGWKGFDPTNGIMANAFFIPTAVAIEPASINPIQGKYFAPGPVTSQVKVALNITRDS